MYSWHGKCVVFDISLPLASIFLMPTATRGTSFGARFWLRDMHLIAFKQHKPAPPKCPPTATAGDVIIKLAQRVIFHCQRHQTQGSRIPKEHAEGDYVHSDCTLSV